MKKLQKGLTLLLCLSMLLGACGALAEDAKALEGKLVFWSMWNETEPQGEAFQKIIDDFVAQNPGVTIDVQWCGRDLSKILKPALEGGEQIDVFDYPLQYGDQLKDFVADMTPYVEAAYPTTDGAPLQDTLLPAMLITPKTQTGVDDKLVAVGYKPWMTLFMYNAAIFEEAGVEIPATWEALDAACAKIKEAGYSPITFDDAYAHWLPGLYLAREKDSEFVNALVNDTTGELWRDDAVVKMAKAFEDFATKGYFDANVGGNKWPAGQMDIGGGKVGMYYNLTGLPTEVADITGEDYKWGAFNFPDTAEGATKFANEGVAGSGMISIGEASEHKDAAAAFIAYVLSPDADAMMVNHAGMIPTLKEGVWPEQLEAVRPTFENVTSVIKVGGDIEANMDLKPIISENFIKLASGAITADEFIENMATAAKQ